MLMYGRLLGAKKQNGQFIQCDQYIPRDQTTEARIREASLQCYQRCPNQNLKSLPMVRSVHLRQQRSPAVNGVFFSTIHQHFTGFHSKGQYSHCCPCESTQVFTRLVQPYTDDLCVSLRTSTFNDYFPHSNPNTSARQACFKFQEFSHSPSQYARTYACMCLCSHGRHSKCVAQSTGVLTCTMVM